MAVRKYELTDTTKTVDGHILHQIKNLNTGELGGWIEKEDNLSQNRGSAWVSGNACVFGDARVFGNAQVSENAMVFGEAQISNRAKIYGEAKVYGCTRVNGDAEVFGNADIFSDITITDDLKIDGSWEAFIDRLWDGAPFAHHKALVNDNQLQRMLDFVTDDPTRRQIFCSTIHGRDGSSMRYVLYDDPHPEAFDRFDSDVAEKFIWTYRHFKRVVVEGETRGF